VIKNLTLPFAAFLCLIIFLVYQPGLKGALYYDDYGNLDGLVNVVDLTSFWQFVNTGFAGPLGRPISLFTFGLQAAAWPEDGGQLIALNIIIHTGNALLLFFLSVEFLKLAFVGISSRSANSAAFTAALLWALLPLNVSTTLITIQRMTGLSSFFVLCGIWCYVKNYTLYQKLPLLNALFLQCSALGLFTLLAIFAKESGALLPLFVLVIELSIARAVSIGSGGRNYRLIILFSCLLAILYYLSPFNMNWFVVNENRGFSAWERIRTEWVLMWGYVKLAVLPIPSAFSPFHDDIEIVRNSYCWAAAGVSWGLLFFYSLLVRKKNYWPFFVVSWFFVGHVIESTSVSLELYFEHRNYLAIYGLCFGFVVLVLKLPVRYKNIGFAFCAAFVVFVALACYATTSLWGRDVVAAEVWSASHPRSSRAALHLGALDAGTAGGSVTEANLRIVNRARSEYRIRAMDRTIAACPECLAVKVQALLFSCNAESESAVKKRLNGVLEYAAIAKGFERVVVDLIYPLVELVDAGGCKGILFDDVSELVNQLLLNPAYQYGYFKSRLFYQVAEVAYRQGDINLAIEKLLVAAQSDPGAQPVMQFQVHLAILNKEWDHARSVVNRWRGNIGNSRDYKIADEILLELDELQRND
jgi:hypothetical protein